ncbi:uncharacterized protein Tco025E_03323 [Trypanosoma conorhini]|uniref:WD repeat protein mio zinc-ribbon like domain-containing protein n=1 Tax=Trypanosoma conorhini TaxID=83891 RepID=A0A3R7PCR6_9TRYP|nr:uncharacterized protein Tco025E_03323 [Trypanosoma conorhini]RNF21521.1 hypothetical protein Tco025E_03323 [Trypanosoma conorhini]
MLLCKQPGDTGVFATATRSNIRIYSFSSTSQLLQEAEGAAAAEATAAADGALQAEANTAGNEWESAAAEGALGGASVRTASAGPAASSAAFGRKRWGRPLGAACAISLWQLRDAETFSVAVDGAQGAGRLYMSRLQCRPTGGRSVRGDDQTNVPLSLSLSCAQGDALRFLYSGRGVGAWIGAENTLSALYTTAAGETSYDVPYLNHGAEIVASGWDPLNAAVLAVGRRSGVVQLLNLEGGNGVKTSMLPHSTAPAMEASSRSSTTQTQLAASTAYTSAPTRAAELLPVSALSVSVVQERPLRGALTSLDWAPHSHTTVVAAERADGIGHCVEVMDLRSPDNGIRYLGMPFETTSAPSSAMNESGAGAPVSAICYAEFVACDHAGVYVATVGSQRRRDVAQLWDLRMTSRHVCQQLHSRAGYTSLSWSMHAVPTVVTTTRSGGLRVHVFGDLRADSDEEERASSGRSSSRASGRLFAAPFPAPRVRRAPKPFEGRFYLQPRVPAAAAAWLGDRRSHAGGLGGATSDENGAGKQGEAKARNSPSHHVAAGSRTDVPCLLLLNAKTGELYPQVFSPVGCRTTMLGDFPLCSAGPNLFALDARASLGRRPERRPAEHERTSVNNNSMGDASAHNNYDLGSETEKCGSSLYNLAESPTSNSARTSLLATTAATGALLIGLTRVDRCLRRLDRLRAGFLPQSNKVFLVLLKEQTDREAYVLFRYGWYMQRYLHPGRATLPVPDAVPGILEWLEQEQRGRAGAAAEAASEVSNLILCAMGWVTNPQEEQLMLTPPGGSGGSAENAAELPGRQVFSSQALPTGPPPPQQQRQQQQAREKSTAVSPSSCSHLSVDEVVEAAGPIASTPPQGPAAPPFAPLDPVDRVGMASLQEAVERRVAILVCMYRLAEASALLLSYGHLNPLYPALALVLLAAASHDEVPPTLTLDVSECSFWMGVCFSFLGTFRTPAAAAAAAAAAGEEHRGSGYDARGGGGGGRDDGGIGDLYRFPLPMRRECLAFLTRWFPQLPLPDRIALATLLLLDPAPTAPCDEPFHALSEVLRAMLQQQFDAGAAGGCSLLLAAAVEGLGGNGVSLQRYVDETCDVQTPVAYAALYGPGKSASWRFWNDAYRSQLNAEGHAILRSLHDLSCKKLARLREQRGVSLAKQDAAAPPLGRLDGFSSPVVSLMGVPFSGLVAGGAAAEAKAKPKRTNRRNVELRCKCGQIVPTAPMEPSSSAAAAATVGRRQQSLCGCPNCLTPMCAVCGEQMFALASGYDVATSYTWCTVCLHGGHWSHLRDWFAKHKTCPAEGCPCRCYCPPLPP